MNSDLTTREKLALIADAIESLKENIVLLRQEVKEMEQQPMVNAKPYFRQGDYLYLIYPQKNGNRKREYIGRKPEKVADALARIRRYKLYKDKKRRLWEKEMDLRRYIGQVDTLLLRLRGQQMRLGV